jgi:hypothetical protein
MKKIFSITFLLLFFCVTLNAQTADRLQTLLQTTAVSYAQAADFVLEAAGIAGSYNETSEQDSLSFAVEKKWLPAKADAQKPISLVNLSHLVMKAFGVKGGPMYTLFNSAHYSYREMVFQDIIQGRSDPHMKVSGEKMIFIVNRLLYRIEENPWEFTEQPELTAEELKMEENIVPAEDSQ